MITAHYSLHCHTTMCHQILRECRAQWYMLVTPELQEAEAGDSQVQNQPGDSFFKSLVVKDVVVELKNDLSICGTLHFVDQHLNIKLTSVSRTPRNTLTCCP